MMTMLKIANIVINDDEDDLMMNPESFDLSSIGDGRGAYPSGYCMI